MSLMDLPELQNRKGKNVAIDQLRENILDLSKSFKTSWVNLAQSLYTVWEDKLYRVWGFVRFEDYTQKELGLRKQISYKLVKTYTFIHPSQKTTGLPVDECERIFLLRGMFALIC